jgi:Tol biopolymer transport system component
VVRAALALVALIGCGRIAFDPLGTGNGDAGGDSAVDAGCWPQWRAGTLSPSPARRLDELGTGAQLSDASVSSDGLTLYYVSNASGNQEILTATRSAPRMAWTPTGAIAELLSPADDTKLSVSADGLLGIFSSARGGADFELYMIERANANDPWSAPTKNHVMALETTRDEFDPHLSADGLRLYFAPITATGGQQLFLASRTSRTADFAIERTLDDVNGNAGADPATSPDELMLTVSIGVPSNVNYTTRATASDSFAPIQPIPVINDPTGHDTDGELSADGCEIYFSSTRAGTKQLYTSILQ